ncbi:DivIVA domain-containing protein [Micromonospora mirobrigensis]|uniref:DivIVA domain-containing protein n=1 Tax=Micromonospora mirobrigensis TaxID=262898 RepID=A0A1C5AGZ9_9ACTN|nr:DivIVA domain-containing protein [Micromonospora mirobrigensis]SCF44480.1 DivIVA domain-containing protein [Micromonospora mirobrigensis]
MRVFLRRIRRRQRSVLGSACYRSAAYHPLRPWQVLDRQILSTRLGRRGLDPREVREFLDRVAGDLAAVYDALAQSRGETDRIKNALRRWQSEQARERNERGYDR